MENCKFVIGKDEFDNNIEIDAIRNESGVWIQNGTILVAPTPEWIAENQPVIEPVTPPKTELELLKEAVDLLILESLR